MTSCQAQLNLRTAFVITSRFCHGCNGDCRLETQCRLLSKPTRWVIERERETKDRQRKTERERDGEREMTNNIISSVSGKSTSV